MRAPLYWATSSSSVSKNHPSSSTRSRIGRTTSVRAALNPQVASVKSAAKPTRSIPLYSRDISSRRAPRSMREPPASRVPMAISQCPEATALTRGSSACSPVDRSTSMNATMSAPLSRHAVLTAIPLPRRSSLRARTPVIVRESRWAVSQVESVLPLSTMVTVQTRGKKSVRKRCTVRMHPGRARSSFRTGMTISTEVRLRAVRRPSYHRFPSPDRTARRISVASTIHPVP